MTTKGLEYSRRVGKAVAGFESFDSNLESSFTVSKKEKPV
jgi:hypothetical protein